MSDTGEDFGLSLINLDGGGAVEMFDHTLQEVIEDLVDVNKDPKAPRSVVLTVVFKPQPGAKMAMFGYKVKSNLAPTNAFEGSVFLEQKTDGGVTAYGDTPIERAIKKVKVREQPEAGPGSKNLEAVT